ncbi:MAG: YbhN family protein [Xanthobacteraceae bacterium]|uniref:lysylphosphatidylglycerol synthase transmembrane domain-containing protein n=1 Tax=Pseudolabrys sp. TaxID=1960880 RepID=UPI003D132520
MTAATKKWTHDLNWLKPLAAAAVIVAAVALLAHALSQYNPDDIVAAIGKISGHRLVLGGLCAAGSYFCLTWFDWLGLRYVGKPLPYRRAALASFTSLSIGHNIGFAGFSSGAIRYRFYTRWGLSLAQVARLVVFSGVTVVLGLLTLGGVAILARPQLAAEVIGLDRTGVLALGVACLAVDALYLAAAALGRGPVRVWRWSLDIPGLRVAMAQIALGAVNYAFVAGCLYNTMADISKEPYLSVATVYVLANTAALVAHVPGGVGVIEGVVAVLLPGNPNIAAVLMFRALYYLMPLAIGGVLFALTELYWRGNRRRTARR